MEQRFYRADVSCSVFLPATNIAISAKKAGPKIDLFVFLNTMNTPYYQHICNGTAHAVARQSRAKEVFHSPELLLDLTRFASDLTNPNLHKALWIIELIALKKPAWVAPYLPQMLEVAPNYTHESAKRAFSNTLAKLCLANLIPENLAEATVELALQWLIQPEKTVPKVMAIRILYHYHIQFPWVVEPLLELMQKDFAKQSPGLQNTIRNISKRLTQEQ